MVLATFYAASHALHKMCAIATDGVARSVCVCVSVCLSVGHVRELCKNG